jgi:hypothetical protein
MYKLRIIYLARSAEGTFTRQDKENIMIKKKVCLRYRQTRTTREPYKEILKA